MSCDTADHTYVCLYVRGPIWACSLIIHSRRQSRLFILKVLGNNFKEHAQSQYTPMFVKSLCSPNWMCYEHTPIVVLVMILIIYGYHFHIVAKVVRHYSIVLNMYVVYILYICKSLCQNNGFNGLGKLQNSTHQILQWIDNIEDSLLQSAHTYI